MKKRHLISTLFVSITASLSVLAGVLTHKQAKSVKANTDDDIAYFITFDASTIPSSWRNECDNFRIYIWYGNGTDREFQMHELGYQDIYTINVTLYDGLETAGYQLRFAQNGVTKYSVDLSGNDFIPYKSGGAGLHYRYSFVDEWPDGKWNVAKECTSSRISLTTPQTSNNPFSYNNAQHGYFNLYTETNISTSADITINLQFGSEFDSNNDYLYSLILNKDLVVPGNARNTFRFKDSCQYSIFINNFSKTILVDGVESTGIIQIKKVGSGWADPNTFGHIYYISERPEEEGNIMMFTFTGAYAQGNPDDFPGTSIFSKEAAVIDCVFGFKFQNKSNYCKVYRILYNTGYINGLDNYIIFSFPYFNDQTADMLLVPGAAYFKTDVPNYYNYEAGAALDLLYDFQTILSGVADYDYHDQILSKSICAIPSSEAARLYQAYISLPQSVRATYIDASYINTYNSDASDKNYISAYNIFTELGKRGGVIPTNSRALFFSTLGDIGNNNIFAIVLVTVVSIASVGAFFTFKKKKQD